MKRISTTGILAGGLLAGAAWLAGTGAAMADDWGIVTGSLAVQSDYRFRGISQNDNDFAPQGSVNWSGPMGFYVGSWASKINFREKELGLLPDSTKAEWDIYGGKHFDLGDGTDLNVEAYYYAYPDHNDRLAGFKDSYYETIVQLSHSFDKLSLTGSVAWSPDFFAETGNGVWVSGLASYRINDWLSVSGQVGHQWAEDLNGLPGYPYTHWDLGVTASWNNWALDLRYVDTSITKNECVGLNGPGNGHWCRATVVATLTYNFTLLE
jgi:uncharacterized protein (TIGR02001 family)